MVLVSATAEFRPAYSLRLVLCSRLLFKLLSGTRKRRKFQGCILHQAYWLGSGSSRLLDLGVQTMHITGWLCPNRNMSPRRFARY